MRLAFYKPGIHTISRSLEDYGGDLFVTQRKASCYSFDKKGKNM